MYSCGRAKFHGMLLIVLNGIEMFIKSRYIQSLSLLIVLNGIEIGVCRNQPVRRPVF